MKGFGGMGNMGQLMKQAQMMQNNVKRVQDELVDLEITGEAGSGAVKVTVTGKYVCRRVEIDPSLLGSVEDKEMVEDLIVAALNDAQKKVEATTEERMKQATGGMKLPF